MPALSILIVEDDDTTRFLLQVQIDRMGTGDVLTIVTNGEEAIDVLHRGIAGEYALPDIVILDPGLPVMDGWEFLDAYARMSPAMGRQAVIVILTTSIDPADMERARSYSFVRRFIVKPLRTGQLEEIRILALDGR